ncbi:hypothetical protein C2I06_22510 [Niallia circulans]|uniref:hypothetical protein n=1 Tax=Niallia circulans TaxID=1397 RepID=UPI000F4595D0|nr:hypothetical protein [Niallia circulans]AYV69395.1 hypothetical protein C2I06_22510 [Niallia circulans]
MREFIGYHCNEAQVIEATIENGVYHISEGHSHWLGNGTYFFDESMDGLEHAQVWGRRMKQHPRIIKNTIRVNPQTLLDLTDAPTVATTNKLKNRAIKGMLKMAGYTPKDGFVDGVFFNMWNKFFSNRPIHVIRKSEFYQTDIDVELKIRSRIDNAIVLCVRNQNCIVEPCEEIATVS